MLDIFLQQLFLQTLVKCASFKYQNIKSQYPGASKMAVKSKRNLTVAIALSLALAGCAESSHRDNFSIGGMLAGAAAGAAIAGGVNDKNAGFAIIGGALIGGLAGFLIGTRLDEAEKQKAEAAAANSAAQGERIYWSSPKRPGEVNGYAEPAPMTPKTESAPVQTTDVAQPTPSSTPTSSTPPSLPAREKSPTDVSTRPTASSANIPTTTTKAATGNTANAAPEQNCRKIREVAILRGTESVIETTYCNTGSGWVRAS